MTWETKVEPVGGMVMRTPIAVCDGPGCGMRFRLTDAKTEWVLTRQAPPARALAITPKDVPEDAGVGEWHFCCSACLHGYVTASVSPQERP